MAYASISIKQLMSDMKTGKYLLPAIQRKFIWSEDDICLLFNSILKDYPIGTFLFWDLTAERANGYTFYKFLENYHERDSKNQLVTFDIESNIRGVLDGQQRISSMFIALQGVYCSRLKYGRHKNNDAFPEKEFYLDLLGETDDYIFRFRSKEEVESSQSLPFRVRDILSYPPLTDVDDILDEIFVADPDKRKLLDDNRKMARRKIAVLLMKVHDDSMISFFKIENKELDDILDIFVRVNSGGTVLSKSDLLFSTLVAHWEDGRDQVEKLISDMNGEDGSFDFNTDFLMRTCLFLVDAPMSFRVKTFDRKNIGLIRENWQKIRSALMGGAAILREFGFNKARLASNYAITPVAYYLYKGGIVTDHTKAELNLMVVHALLKRVFSGQADSALRELRDGLREKNGAGGYILRRQEFEFKEFKNVKLSGGKRLSIDAEDIEEFLLLKKGAYTFLVLSLLYPDLKLGQVDFHQDHMHPHSGFSSSSINQLGLTGETLARWLDMRDQLPNLQLLEGKENVKKQAEPLSSWVSAMQTDQDYYKKRNFIPLKVSLDIAHFDDFFVDRKEVLKVKLKSKLLS